MPLVTTVGASAHPIPGARTGTDAALPVRLVRSAGTAVGILAAVLLVLLQPLYLHAALDAAGAPAVLSMAPAEAHRLSDLTVRELLFGPGRFAFAGPDGRPFFDPSEAAHMRDVRAVLYGFLLVAAVAVILAAVSTARDRHRASAWRDVARGGGALAVGLLAAGLVTVVAFEPVFELFHRVFFPGGNYSFDPARQRLVQLYPLPFWRITSAVLGATAIVAGGLTWWLAHRRARALAARGAAGAGRLP